MGHELVPYTPPDMIEGVRLGLDCIFGDNGKSFDKHLDGEQVDPCLSFIRTLSTVPPALTDIAKSYLKTALGEINVHFARRLPYICIDNIISLIRLQLY